ncbi:1-acyl-sn-glycerol-3-phosphate acyltransferase, partial [bacterium]|nr:1-acyl-sn-glycerol-3-phosphate acyltransferase [bacterium]
SGKNINPVEIEQVLESMELVAEAAVTVVDDRLHAIIRLDSIAGKNDVASHQLVRSRIIDQYNRNATPHKIIQGLTIISNELPRTSLGKLRRFLLDDLIQSARLKPVESGSDVSESEEQAVSRSYLASLTGREVSLGDHVDSTLGMDSLDKVTFQVFLKKSFGVEIDQTELSDMESIGAIGAMVQERKTQMEVSEVNWSDVFRETIHVKLPKSWITNRIMKFVALIFLKLYFRVSTENVDKLPDGPCIITPNHQSFIDALLVAAMMKNHHFNKTYFYAKAKHVRKMWVKFIADRHNVIVMDINMDVKSSIQKLAEVLKQGRKIMIFPEGTRSLDGTVGDFRKTFAILSRELSVPVVPVSINGAFEALPPGARFPRPFKRISIIFQDPVYPCDESYETLMNRIKTSIKDKLQKRYQ